MGLLGRFEARSTKFETSTNFKMQKNTGKTVEFAFPISNFEFVSDFGFRISDLGDGAMA